MAFMEIEFNGHAFTYRGAYFQSDWDWVPLACSLGWNIARVQYRKGAAVPLARRPTAPGACMHRHTDGSVDCPDCNVRAGDFIGAAFDFLHARATS